MRDEHLRSPPSKTPRPLAETDVRWARYAALAAAIHVLEAGLPSPVPGIKPGLANVITLIVLCRHGWTAACWVTALRVLLSALVLGTLFGPTFWLSLGGALSALSVLGLAYLWMTWLPRLAPGPVGVSVLAALAHIQGQFWLAYVWFIPHPGLLSLLPLLGAAAVISGLLTGLLAAKVLERMPAVQPSLPAKE